MMSNLERLVYMANQIAANFAILGEAEAITATAHHIADFWDPRMKANIRAVLEQNSASLTPMARAAVGQLPGA
ncbi:MAG: formate dehydrogenase subunit delta [Sphingobium sp.]